MKFYVYTLILNFWAMNIGEAKPLNLIELPQMVRALIKHNRKDCNDLKDLDEKSGEYNIGNAISHLRYLNHDIEYIIYFSEGAQCTASTSFDQGNGGSHLIIFANPSKKWAEIYNDQVLDYKIVVLSSSEKKVPANLIIHRKGIPDFTVEEIEYEWNIKDHRYKQKNIKEDIYHQNKSE
ncbi:hypothetical protein [Candidatus Odyssella acanthamoebae]|nr:hypothetical protein [Candidatus Paracaedibacter acanthamoebae]